MLYRIRHLALVAITFLFIATPSIATTYQFEPVEVQISGRLVFEKHYGPPNFGESPSQDQEMIPVLYLDAPADIIGNPAGNSFDQRTYHNISKIQLIGPPQEYRKFSGKRIMVVGTLSGHDVSPEQFADVLFWVKSMSLRR